MYDKQDNIPDQPSRGISRRSQSQGSIHEGAANLDKNKIKGLLGFQNSSYINEPAKNVTETFEVTLNIKDNKTVSKKKKLSKNMHHNSQPELPKQINGARHFPIKSLKTMHANKLPNLLKNLQMLEKIREQQADRKFYFTES